MDKIQHFLSIFETEISFSFVWRQKLFKLEGGLWNFSTPLIQPLYN